MPRMFLPTSFCLIILMLLPQWHRQESAPCCCTFPGLFILTTQQTLPQNYISQKISQRRHGIRSLRNPAPATPLIFWVLHSSQGCSIEKYTAENLRCGIWTGRFKLIGKSDVQCAVWNKFAIVAECATVSPVGTYNETRAGLFSLTSVQKRPHRFCGGTSAKAAQPTQVLELLFWSHQTYKFQPPWRKSWMQL